MADDRRANVVVVGSVNVDFVVRVATLPGPGETVSGGVFERHHGGKGANQAVAAARLGARVVFVGAVGDDDLGRLALRELGSEGVDVSLTSVVEGEPTGVALIVVSAGGENQIAVASGANALLSGAMVERALAESVGAGEKGTVVTGFEVSDEAVVAAARFAEARGWRTVITPAPARALVRPLVELHPILVPNAGEARALTGVAEPTVAARVLAAEVGGPVVVTLARDGALVINGGRATVVPAPTVEVVDTTGAGDTLAGALAAELARGSELEQAARLAVVAASLSVTAAGARGGMPRRAAVEALLHLPG